MTEKVKKFLQILSVDEALGKKAANAATIEEVIALAKEKGIELTEEDVCEANRESAHVDESELEAVVGGGACACVWGGYGAASDKNDGRCVCVLAGYGNGGPSGLPRCVCPQTGGGVSKD